MTNERAVREALSEALMSIYDHGTQPNAFREADAILSRFDVTLKEGDQTAPASGDEGDVGRSTGADLRRARRLRWLARHLEKVARNSRRLADAIDGSEARPLV